MLSAWRKWTSTEHLGLALTLGYVFLSAIGMLHRALVFLKFRINIVDYAEPSDFLLAALRDPLIVLASLAPIPLVWVYFRFAQWLRESYKDNKYLTGGERGQQFYQRHRSALYVSTIILWAIAFSMHYARIVADDLREGRGRRVQIELVNGSVMAAGDTVKPLLIGTTQRYIFVYDDRTRITTVIPENNVARILYQRPAPTKK